MTHLFRGYALQFGPAYDDVWGNRVRIEAGALRFAAVVNLHCGHDRSRTYASTADGSLDVICDSFGLRVSFSLEGSRAGYSLAASIARRDFHGLSSWTSIESSHDEGGTQVITGGIVEEISVVTDPLCPGCWAWPADADPADLPDHLQAAAQLWAAAASAPLPGIIAAAGRRPGPELLARIDRILSAGTCIRGGSRRAAHSQHTRHPTGN